MNKRRISSYAVLGVAVIAFSTRAVAVTMITNTKHNLSSSSSNTIKALATGTNPKETQICIFCHAPHNTDSTQAPLWNHQETSAATFQMASSAHVVHSGSSKRSWADGAPTGISKKCLSCHDGTVAIGAILTGTPIQVTGASGGSGDTLYGTRNATGGLQSGDYGFIGTDLRGGHVISFNYKAAVDSFDSSHVNYNGWDAPNAISDSDKKSMFDRQGRMQCHSCHDPHNDWCDDGFSTIGGDPLWRKACGGGGVGNRSVCDVCHRSAPGPGFLKYSF